MRSERFLRASETRALAAGCPRCALPHAVGAVGLSRATPCLLVRLGTAGPSGGRSQVRLQLAAGSAVSHSEIDGVRGEVAAVLHAGVTERRRLMWWHAPRKAGRNAICDTRSAADSERPTLPPTSMITMLSPSAGSNAILTILQLIVLEVLGALRCVRRAHASPQCPPCP